MPTAVLDLEMKNLPEEISVLEKYGQAYALLRYNGDPVGRAYLPVKDGKIKLKECAGILQKAIKRDIDQAWIKHYTGLDETDTIGMRAITATIAICTRNRPDDLKRCLDALVALPDDGQEILVIDNCPSTDDSKRLVQEYPSVRYVREMKPGLDNARNRALAEAKHDVIAFTDDDATPDAGWLRAIVKNFKNPLVYCVTGLVMPLELETEAQEAFEKYSPFQKGFRRRVHTNKNRSPVATGQVGAGASMAVRKQLADHVGLFDEALDAGTITNSGGDHEMFTRILAAGYQIVYEPEALSWHRHRRTWKELHDTIHGYGIGVYSLFTKHLIVHKEFGVIKLALGWFWYDQLPALVKAILRKPGSQPRDLVLAELKGCLKGPSAYFASRKKVASAKIKTV